LLVAKQCLAKNIERRTTLKSNACQNRCILGAGIGVAVSAMISQNTSPSLPSSNHDAVAL
jgi:hypothetical protein